MHWFAAARWSGDGFRRCSESLLAALAMSGRVTMAANTSDPTRLWYPWISWVVACCVFGGKSSKGIGVKVFLLC